MEAYFTALVGEGAWPSEPALRRYLQWLFDGVDLEGARVLDIGGGTGEFSFYMAAAGASSVTCLEPEAEGGSEGMNDTFARLQRAAGLDNVRLVRDTFQHFTAPAGSFDVMLVHNSINHLDEAATIRLDHDPAAREVYLGLFRKIAELMAPGGSLLITDCARTNLFPLLRIPHPISRSIEWHKHQDPELWAGLLRQAGFEEPRIGWSSYNRLGRLGWAVLANRVGAFLTTGHFRLVMRRRQ